MRDTGSEKSGSYFEEGPAFQNLLSASLVSVPTYYPQTRVSVLLLYSPLLLGDLPAAGRGVGGEVLKTLKLN